MVKAATLIPSKREITVRYSEVSVASNVPFTLPNINKVDGTNKITETINVREVSGESGKDGVDGVNGVDGKDGRDGVDGRDGRDGVDGKDGVDGRDGINGVNGVDGRNGKDGKDGVDGVDGTDGNDGVDGRDGKDGKDGKDGVNGVDGRDGKDGVDGRDGVDGKDGVDGLPGPIGACFPIEGPVDSHISFMGADGKINGLVNSPEMLSVYKDGISRMQFLESSIDLVGCVSQVKHKIQEFNESVTIFRLKLTANHSYMMNIRAVVRGVENYFYQGIGIVIVDADGKAIVNFPSESVFSTGFEWRQSPESIDFIFETTENGTLTSCGRIDILSDGDTLYACE